MKETNLGPEDINNILNDPEYHLGIHIGLRERRVNCTEIMMREVGKPTKDYELNGLLAAIHRIDNEDNRVDYIKFNKKILEHKRDSSLHLIKNKIKNNDYFTEMGLVKSFLNYIEFIEKDLSGPYNLKSIKEGICYLV